MIILSAGHFPADPGACYPHDNPHWCEHAEAEEWVNRIAPLVRQQMKVGVVPTGPLAIWSPPGRYSRTLVGGKVFWINEQCRRNDVKLAVELHFNSDTSKRQRGCETLYCPGSAKGEVAAQIVQGAMAGLFPPSRGAKEGWHRMDHPGHVDYPGDVDGDEKIDFFLKATHCTALIIEPEFIYNRQTIESNRRAACEVIAAALIEAAKKI
jgi:hypothetical protein